MWLCVQVDRFRDTTTASLAGWTIHVHSGKLKVVLGLVPLPVVVPL